MHLPIFLSNFINLFKTNKIWALFFIFYFFSISGMPPFVGFLGKFYLFLTIIKSQNIALIIFLMIVASFSSFYYIRVLKLIFFETQKNKKINQVFQGHFSHLYQDVSITIICFISFFLVISFF